jgi:hypothetical protein
MSAPIEGYPERGASCLQQNLFFRKRSDCNSPGAELSRRREGLIQLLNEDLAREYQAIIAYGVYSQGRKGAAYMSIAGELEKPVPALPTVEQVAGTDNLIATYHEMKMNLRQGQTAQLLGFTLSERDGWLQLKPGQDSWVKLERDLVRAHETADPAKTAHQVVSDWVGAHGPAFESWQVKPLDHILHVMAGLGFREQCSSEKLADQCETAWKRWSAFREKVGQTEQSVEPAGIR